MREIIRIADTYLPEEIAAYEVGWKVGRGGSIRLPPRYQDNPPLQEAYQQGYYDAHAGRDNDIAQDRTYEQ